MKTMSILLLAGLGLSACNNAAEKEAAAQAARQGVIDSMSRAAEKQRIIDSMNLEMAKKEEVQHTTVNNTTVNSAPAAPAKKKWSKTAKGALIGAGAGAITGAVVNKKRVEGAVVGGMIGAGVGAITGAVMDNQDQKKTASQPK